MDRSAILDQRDTSYADDAWEADGVVDAHLRDARRDAPVDAATDVSFCPAGTSFCPGLAGNGCVNLAGSQEHCGRCGHACGVGEVCRDSSCQPACRATVGWDLPEMTSLPNTTGITMGMGDLDGDGDLDVAVSRSPSYEVWRNQGNSRFEPWTAELPALDTAERVTRVGLGDFNGDGRRDLLLGLRGDSSGSVAQFLLLTANEKGGFQRAGTAKLTRPASGWLVADMDGDQRADIVVYDEKEISVWLGQADGPLTEAGRAALTARIYRVVVADVNGDGQRDLVASFSSEDNGLWVYLASGRGALAPAVVTPFAESHVPLAVADLDHDGVPELLAGIEKGAVLLKGSPDGHLVDPRPVVDDFYLYTAAFVDLDKDGELDLIAGTEDEELRIAYGKGDGSFGPAQRYLCPVSTMLTVEDFDRDGRQDLAMYTSLTRSLQVYKGRTGDFPGFRVLPEGQKAGEGAVWSGKGPVTADFNEDGIPDTAQITNAQTTLDVTLSGDVDAGLLTVRYPAPSIRGLVALDIDLDGHLDLAFPSPWIGMFTILLGRGDGSFDQRLSIPVPLTEEDVIGFSPPRPGRGRDLLVKHPDGLIGVAASTGRSCPADAGP